jgi:hypothetical protein
MWMVLRTAAKLSGKRQDAALSLVGRLIVVLLIAFWALGLTVGAALVIQPELGTAIQPSSGVSPTDFVTALFVGGNSLSIVGGGDYSPHTTETRLFFLMNSLVGASVLSLVLSYLVQVYSALRERNALALTVDLMTDGTGGAAEMLARLMPAGDTSNATSELGNLARSLAATKEAHHFYPLLFYFRFEAPLYAVSRFSFVLLELTTLIATALDHGDETGSATSLQPKLWPVPASQCNWMASIVMSPRIANGTFSPAASLRRSVTKWVRSTAGEGGPTASGGKRGWPMKKQCGISLLSGRPHYPSRLPPMPVRRLLKSWASPPVNWPTASIFCD